jgi:hypothetical protein
MSLTQQEIDDLSRKTSQLYNRIKSPQVTTKVKFATPDMLTISFSGGFCYGCGILDYVEGFAQEFKVLSGNAELKVGKTREITPRTFEADYFVKRRG